MERGILVIQLVEHCIGTQGEAKLSYLVADPVFNLRTNGMIFLD